MIREGMNSLFPVYDGQPKIDFCQLCQFYECELVEEYMLIKKNNPTLKFPSYDQKELQKKCVMKKFIQVRCDNKSVTEGIGDHFKIEIYKNTFNIKTKTEDKWEPSQPVFISAQTGQGKNYFIENTLLPYVKELNYKHSSKKKILIISNRNALKRQIHDRTKGNVDQDNEQDKIYHCNEYIHIINYQGLKNKVKKLKKTQENKQSNYIFVVCDEAHFFTSDSMFNPDTEKILAAIVKIFYNAIRIYMTATPYECLKYIRQHEKNEKGYIEGVLYNFKRNYSYLDIKYYSEIDELKDLIVKSVNEKREKWLIFIDDKEKCKSVKSILEKYGEENGSPMKIETKNSEMVDMIVAVDADSKNNRDYQDMVSKEKLNKHTYVLISTSVLDNGVNLTGIHNIVVSDMAKVKVLQMVGRARVERNRDKPAKKTLYIKRFNKIYIQNRINDFERQRYAYYKYSLAYEETTLLDSKRGYSEHDFLNEFYNDKEEDWKDAKYWFGRNRKNPTELYPNGIARSLVERLVPKYKLILEEMQRTDHEHNPAGQNYLEHQFSWFGKKYDEKNDITLVGKGERKNELIEFLESYVGRKLSKDNKDQEKFREEFTRLSNEAFGRQDPNKSRKYAVDKINKILKKYNLNYELKNKTLYCILIRHNTDLEEAGINADLEDDETAVALHGS